MIRRSGILIAVLATLVVPGSAHADFGLVPGTTTVTPENRDGTIATQAGSHPYAFSIHFELNTDENGISEGGEMRDVLSDLPPGLFGNPQAVSPCPRQSFEGDLPQCPVNTQVGTLRVILPGIGEANGPIYNLVPPSGVAAQLGFSSTGFIALFSASVNAEDEYGVHIEAPNLPIEAVWVTATIWGTPADPGHDPERGPSGGLSSDAPLIPFLTLPTSCEEPPLTTIEVDSKLAPGFFVGETVPFEDKAGHPQALSGCEAVPFSPQVEAGPSSNAAETASGFGFRLGLPNQGLTNSKEGAVTETEPEATVLTLPAGLTANPAVASGLAVCTPDEYEAATAISGPNQGCPQSSKIGTLIAHSPLIEETIEGSLYVAAPHNNPFDSLLALYIVAKAPQRGVLVKQAVEVQPDPLTGQLTSIVEELPPVPYSDFEVRLREGPRAPLITPQTCGDYPTTAFLFPFSEPETAYERSAPFKISQRSGGGGPCANSEGELPFAPALLAGTTAPLAGGFSPFVFKLSRSDGEQRLSALETTLPEGLVAKLAGVPYCPESAIAAATARSSEGQGALEAASPSCPPASEVGTVTAGAGAGPTPYYVGGKAYLAGPYKGAPFSLVIVTPAIAGPFDLGVVVVRAGIYVNEANAQVTVKSDPLPKLLHGLPLDVRSVAVRMERPNFILNPTSCEAKSISANAYSTAGASATLQNRFQVGSCKGLDFSPKLKLSLKGATRRSGHPAFKAVLTQAPGQANIARTSVALPPTVFLDQAHVSNPCTRPQFAAHACSPSSILGKAQVFTPLLDAPLEGPIYFRSNGGERELPDVVVDLNGQVHFVLVGFVDALHKKGSEKSRIRTTFASVPDAPVSKAIFSFNAGKKKGLFVNSANICKTANKAIVKMRAQNGKALDSKPRVGTSCKK